MQSDNLLADFKVLIKLSINDIKSRYAGSVLGIVWAFVQPLVTILVFWFVFQLGFRNPPVNNIEFILWFSAAYIPWIFFNESVNMSANCLYEYSYLVKKIKFKTYILPLVKIISGSFVHTFFVGFITLLFLLYGYPFQMSWLNALYYSFSLFALLIGISWIVSSISVFLKDFAQIINIFLQIGFWVTPIFWSTETMKPEILTILKFNPLYYVVIGYRSCFIDGINFWERGPINYYYWSIVIITFILGYVIYKKLSPHFSDIL